MLNHGNTLVQLLHCLSLSSCQLESTLPPAAQLLLSQTQQGNLVGYCLRLSNVLENISRPNHETLFATNTSHGKQEIFLYKYPLYRILLTTKMHSSSTVAILTIKPSLKSAHARLLPRLPWSWTVLLPSDTYYVHYGCFTSICGLFTDPPSYNAPLLSQVL
jgi:hypothetical protein